MASNLKNENTLRIKLTMIGKVGIFSIASLLLISCQNGSGGFERGDFSGWFREFPKEYSGQIVTSPVRCGKYAARFEIRSGDRFWMGGNRTEIHEYFAKAPFHKEVWYGFSTFVPNDWPDLENRTVISQWHATPDKGEAYRSPPLAIRYIGGQLRVTGITSNKQIQKMNDGRWLSLYNDRGRWKKGGWNDWIFQVIWSWEQDGMVKAWLNDTQVIDYQGPIGYRDDAGPWFKMGIYRDDHDVPQILFHDEYRKGASFAEVNPSHCDRKK